MLGYQSLIVYNGPRGGGIKLTCCIMPSRHCCSNVQQTCQPEGDACEYSTTAPVCQREASLQLECGVDVLGIDSLDKLAINGLVLARPTDLVNPCCR